MTIQEIQNNDEVSIRSLNVCLSNNIFTLDDLKLHYTQFGTFENLRNCGKKSNNELFEILNNSENSEIDTSIIQNRISFIENIKNLSSVQTDIINNFIEINIKMLSVRSFNGISNYLNNNHDIKHIAENILFSNTFRINKIRNIGDNSIQELELFILHIKDFITEVFKTETEAQLFRL